MAEHVARRSAPRRSPQPRADRRGRWPLQGARLARSSDPPPRLTLDRPRTTRPLADRRRPAPEPLRAWADVFATATWGLNDPRYGYSSTTAATDGLYRFDPPVWVGHGV